MQRRTKLRLVRFGGLLAVLPMAFVLFAAAIGSERGPIVSGALVALPLGLYGVGFFLVLQKFSDRSNRSNSSS